MNDFFSNFKITDSINSILGNNDTEGTGVGVRVWPFTINVVKFSIGISGDTLSGTVKLEPKIQESDNSTNGVNGTWNDVAAADLQQSTISLIDDAAEDAVQQYAAYVGYKAWIRAFVDFTGTHTAGIPIQAEIIQGNARLAPPA